MDRKFKPRGKTNDGKSINAKEAIKTVGEWISEETHKRKYDTSEVVKLSEALIVLRDMAELLEG